MSKRRSPGLWIGSLVGACLALQAFAQETETQSWTAPPYWAPPFASTGERSGRSALAASQALAAGPVALPFIALPPCRLVDTRGNGAPLTGGFLPSATVRSYTLAGACGVPSNAKAISLNATVVKPVGPGFLVLWPQDGAFPPVSTLNYLGNDVIVNAAVVPLSSSGGISMALGVSGGDVILDTNGYYAATPSVTSLNTQTGDVILAAGTNVTITPGAGMLTIASTGGSGGPPTGPAGGSLAGTYPNPTLAANSVGTTQIQANAVGGSQIQANAVGPTQIAAGAVTDAKVASGIAYSKVTGAPSSLPPNGAAGGGLAGTYPNPTLAAAAVGAAQIADGSVTDVKIAGVSFGKVTGVPGFVLKAGDTMTGTLTLSTGNLNLTTQPSTATSGSILKNGAPFIHDYGTENVFVGTGAGNFILSGAYNTAVGFQALAANTTGANNSALGNSALPRNTTGSQNTALGNYALNLNTTGSFNTALGQGALLLNATGSENTAIGLSALILNEAGSRSTAVGRGALSLATAGNNTGVGYLALEQDTSGTNNTAVGYRAGARDYPFPTYNNQTLSSVPITTGSFNTFVGHGAGSVLNVNNCTAVGIDAYCDGDNQVRLGNTFVGSIGGKVGWSALSDARAKKEIRDLESGLDLVLKLRPVTYRLLSGNGRTDMGFVAQEVEAAIGESFNILTVGGDEDRTLSLRYQDFVAPLVKAVQEQQVTLERDRREILDLRERLGRLEKLLVELLR